MNCKSNLYFDSELIQNTLNNIILILICVKGLVL